MIPNSKIPKLRLLHYKNSFKLSVIRQNNKSNRLMTNK